MYVREVSAAQEGSWRLFHRTNIGRALQEAQQPLPYISSPEEAQPRMFTRHVNFE